MHQQRYIQVNAPVDKGIASLVAALSQFQKLQTIESCQGDDSHIAAWICFQFGHYWLHPWKDLAEFVLGYFGPGLASKIGNMASVDIHIRSNGEPQGEIRVRPGAIDLTTKAVRELAAAYFQRP